MNYLSNTIGLHSGRLSTKRFILFKKTFSQFDSERIFQQKGVSVFLLELFCPNEKQRFQIWSSIKSAKLDISKIADTILLKIYLGIELRKCFFEQNKKTEKTLLKTLIYPLSLSICGTVLL